MHDQILEALYSRVDAATEEARRAYIESLVPVPPAIWDSFQRAYVQVDYNDPRIQAAYMLRYFPSYSQLLPRVLAENGVGHYLRKRAVEATLYACGAGPEAYGLLQYLQGLPEVESVHLNLLDAKDWELGRSICFENLIPSVWSKGIESRTLPCDLSSLLQEEAENSEALARSDIVIMQNCINEIGNAVRLQSNIQHMVDQLAPGALLVIIDRGEYTGNRSLIQRLASLNDVDVLAAGDPRTFDCRALNQTMPNELYKWGLFARSSMENNYDGRIIATSIDYLRLVVRRH